MRLELDNRGAAACKVQVLVAAHQGTLNAVFAQGLDIAQTRRNVQPSPGHAYIVYSNLQAAAHTTTVFHFRVAVCGPSTTPFWIYVRRQPP